MRLRTDRTIVFPDLEALEFDDAHIVEPGETIVEIARNYGVTVRELREANLALMDSGSIYVGQMLEIPEPSTSPGSVFQRDIDAFALQYRARANVLKQSESYWRNYLREVVIRYSEPLNPPELVETDEVKES